MAREPRESRYQALIHKIFFDRFQEGMTEFEFAREAMETAAAQLEIPLPKNLGDVIYSVRFRTPLPDEILATQASGMEWMIEGAGRGRLSLQTGPH